MKAKFTPGPWFVTYTRNRTANVGPSHNCTVAALLMAPVGNMHANARLIAAAPELLEALQAIVASLAEHDDEGMIEHAEQMIAARAAIAAATGDNS